MPLAAACDHPTDRSVPVAAADIFAPQRSPPARPFVPPLFQESRLLVSSNRGDGGPFAGGRDIV